MNYRNFKRIVTRSAFVAVAALVAGCPAPSSTAPMLYTFAGTITAADGETGGLVAGDPISFEFVVDLEREPSARFSVLTTSGQGGFATVTEL